MNSDIAVVVNLRARRGSERVARLCGEVLPNARVFASGTLTEAKRAAEEIARTGPGLVVSGGGDGTALALLNALHEASPKKVFGSVFGVLPLGTGNAWAHATGAPGWRQGVERLSTFSPEQAFPSRRFDLLSVDGVITHFAGSGWDAEIIDDFYAQKQGFGILPERFRKGLWGYMQALALRTIPRNVVSRRPVEVEIVNTGDHAVAVDDAGRPVRMKGGENGAVLYRGPVTVSGAGTTEEYGFRFKAFPFAHLVPRRFSMRVYAGGPLVTTFRAARIWQGVHPIPDSYTWLLTSCRATFSEPVPFQIGGDRAGHRTVVDYALADSQVDLLDWSAMRPAA